jgi:Porin subfamily
MSKSDKVMLRRGRMDRWITRWTIFRAVVVVAATMLVSGVIAQTLTEPDSKTKLPPPSVAAKSIPAGRAKSCSTYGAGFVNIPGTDACIKIGGYVTTEGTINRGH